MTIKYSRNFPNVSKHKACPLASIQLLQTQNLPLCNLLTTPKHKSAPSSKIYGSSRKTQEFAFVFLASTFLKHKNSPSVAGTSLEIALRSVAVTSLKRKIHPRLPYNHLQKSSNPHFLKIDESKGIINYYLFYYLFLTFD